MNIRPILTTEQIDEALDLLESGAIFMEHFVPVEDALADGFDIDAYCERVNTLIAGVRIAVDDGAEPDGYRYSGGGRWSPTSQ